MATTKVSALTEKTSPSGTEELLISDSGTSKKIKISNLPDNDTTYTASGLVAISGSNVISTTANNYTHPNHSGEVTSTADGATVIEDNIVDEANLKVSNAPTNGYVLTAQSGDTGGLTWAAASTTDSTKLPLAGGTLTGNLNLGDNVKAQFGASNDLQIYHDGGASRIVDSGTGYLKMQVDGQLAILNSNDTAKMADFYFGGAVDLYHNNSKKLATTSTGIDVTGTVTATRIGSGTVATLKDSGGHGYQFDIPSSSKLQIASAQGGKTLDLWANELTFSAGGSTRMTITSTGKIALGGYTSPTVDSQVAIHGGNLELTTAGSRYWIARASDGALTGSLYSPSGSEIRLSGAGTSSGSIAFEPSSTSGTAMTITSTGNVGIGTASPSPTKLAILAGGSANGVLLARNASASPTSGQDLGSFGFKGIMDGVNSLNAAEARITAYASETHSGSTAGTGLTFWTKPSGTGPGSGPTERLRIQSGGGISFNGDTAAANALDDYEEGTWTPVPVCTHNCSSWSVTGYSNSNSRYTKIGNVVHFWFSVTINSISGSSPSNLGISGLPFSTSLPNDSVGNARSNDTGNLYNLESVSSSQIGVVRKYDNGNWDSGATLPVTFVGSGTYQV